MHAADDGGHGRRLRGLIVILWRAGLRIHEALALAEADLDQRRGAVLVCRGKGGRRREVGMDAWGWAALQPWLQTASSFPSGRSSACSLDRRVGVHGPAPPHGLTSVTRRSRRRSPSLRAAPTPSRARRRAGARRRAADRDPEPTRPQQPRRLDTLVAGRGRIIVLLLSSAERARRRARGWHPLWTNYRSATWLAVVAALPRRDLGRASGRAGPRGRDPPPAQPRARSSGSGWSLGGVRS
jgi:hypothetical protein